MQKIFSKYMFPVAVITAFVMMLAPVATFPQVAEAASSGPNSATLFAGNISISSGDHNWSNESNAATSDNSRATVTITDDNNISNYLRATGFGFAIPGTAV